jgi:hypothetical protein
VEHGHSGEALGRGERFVPDNPGIDRALIRPFKPMRMLFGMKPRKRKAVQT